MPEKKSPSAGANEKDVCQRADRWSALKRIASSEANILGPMSAGIVRRAAGNEILSYYDYSSRYSSYASSIHPYDSWYRSLPPYSSYHSVYDRHLSYGSTYHSYMSWT